MMFYWRLCCFVFLIIGDGFCTVTAKDEKPSGYLVANSVTTFQEQGEFVYNFYDGEGVSFTCLRSSGRFVKLVLTDNEVVNSSGYQPDDSVEMYMRLGTVNSGSTLECTITDNFKNEYVITLKLVVYKSNRGILGFKVNDLIVPHSKNYGVHGYYYYKYINGENITLAVIKDNDLYQEAKCSVIRENETSLPETLDSYFKDTEYKTFSDVLAIYQLRKKHTSSRLRCYMARKDGANCQIVLQFIYDSPDEDGVDNSCLAMSKTLLKYKKGKDAVIVKLNKNDVGPQNFSWNRTTGTFEAISPTNKSALHSNTTNETEKFLLIAVICVLSIICFIQMLAFIVWCCKSSFKKRSLQHSNMENEDPLYENTWSLSSELHTTKELVRNAPVVSTIPSRTCKPILQYDTPYDHRIQLQMFQKV